MRTFAAVLLTLTCGAALALDPWNSGGSVKMLSPEQAFALQPAIAQGKTLQLQWDIAPGYYLYRSRIKVEAVEPGVKLGALRLPDGEKIHDEHFGDVEIYRKGLLKAELPVNQTVRKLKVSYQGCAEIGVCLPPQTRVIDVLNP